MRGEVGKNSEQGARKPKPEYIALKNLFSIKEEIGKDLKKHNYFVKKGTTLKKEDNRY